MLLQRFPLQSPDVDASGAAAGVPAPVVSAPIVPAAAPAPTVLAPPAAPPAPAAPAAKPPAFTDAELVQMQADAKAHRDHQTAELARIETRKAALPEPVQKALDASQGLAAKQAILAAFDVAAPPKQTHTPPASTGAPAPALDFAEAFKTAETWAAVKARDPVGASAWFRSRGAGGVSSVTSLSSLTRAPTKTA